MKAKNDAYQEKKDTQSLTEADAPPPLAERMAAPLNFGSDAILSPLPVAQARTDWLALAAGALEAVRDQVHM